MLVPFVGVEIKGAKRWLNFFNQFELKIIRAEKINTHGGSLRIYVKKDKNSKIDTSVKALLKEEDEFGIKNYKTYQEFADKVYKIQKNVKTNIKKLKSNGKKLIGFNIIYDIFYCS